MAEAAARTFELRQLQEQMNPHFLFNALNAVAASKDDPEAVESVPLAGKTASLAVTVGDICWIESLRNYTRVAIKPPLGVMLLRRRLSYWDKVLPVEAFARVSRSYIVQVAASSRSSGRRGRRPWSRLARAWNRSPSAVSRARGYGRFSAAKPRNGRR